MDNILGDDIADCVLKEFSKWPSKRKPLNRGDGVKEWVPLAGIVAQVNGELICLAAATGMKCLPQSKIHLAQGTTLHDWHAEILAIRSLNRFLLEECRQLALSQNYASKYIRLRSPDEKSENHSQTFALKDEIKLHMYCSEAPCGDASMELTMSLQSDSTPWELPSSSPSAFPATDSSSHSQIPTLLQGRSYFSHLGTIRRKPSRPDAPPTLSKSCSDKLALKQSTSLLSSLVCILISPKNIYLSTLILPASQYSETACTRCFSASPSGRLFPLLQQTATNTTKASEGEEWKGGHTFHQLIVTTTEKEFAYSRRQVLAPGETLVPSNLASFSTPLPILSGTLIGGTVQGRRQFSPKGASPLCKLRMWQLALNITDLLKGEAGKNIEGCLRVESYSAVKISDELRERRNVKKEVRIVLGGEAGEAGWVRNTGGESFSLIETGD